MAEIDGLGYMLEALRRRISSNSTRTGRLGAASHDLAKSASEPTIKSKTSVGELRQKVRERIRALPQDGLADEEHAARVFLESVLLWEFGDDVAPSPELAGLVSDIAAEMRSHPELQRDLATLIDNLVHE